MKHSKTYLLIPLAAILCMGCGNQDSSTAGSISATTMRLERSQGAVQVQDDAGEGVDLQEKLPLYSGYALDTPSDSYAWVNLDDTKLAKMDQESGASIYKEDKHLELTAKYGSMFFHVTQALEEDETFDIRMDTLSVGIRGTYGWVEHTPEYACVYILNGTVVCTLTDDGSQHQVSSGEMLQVASDAQEPERLQTGAFTLEDIPDYVWEELDQAMQDEAQNLLAQQPESSPSPEPTEEPSSEEPEEETDPADLPPDQRARYYMDFRAEGNENIFAGNVTLFGQEIDGITISGLRDLLVNQGLANSSLYLEEIEGLGTQLMYPGTTGFLDLPVDAVQSPNASSFTTFGWTKEFPAGTDMGVLDIKVGDSLETVLDKMGFTNAQEIGAVLREAPDIRVSWDSDSLSQQSIADFQIGDKVSDSVSFEFGVWNQYQEAEAFLELTVSAMYKTSESGANNSGNLNLFFNESYEVYSLSMSLVQN